VSRDEESVRGEFIAEAQELIEGLSRDLLLLDHGQKEGSIDPDLINAVFRGVHTLKGISGMFGFAELGEVSHVLEDLLDDLRLGRVELTQTVLDVLFEGVEVLQRLLTEDEGPSADGDRFRERVRAAQANRSPADESLADLGFDESVLSVLTEYEEHRLRANVEAGTPLYRLRVRFALASIDTDLEGLKERAKPLGEIITYLPSMDGGEEDAIDLEVLLASRSPEARLREALAGVDGAVLERLAGPGGDAVETPPRTAPGAAMTVPPTAPGAATAQELEAPVATSRAGEPRGAAIVSKTVRVDIAKLDHLMNVVGELAIVRSAVARVTEHMRADPERRRVGAELHRIHRQFERHLESLQDGILDVRMVPLRQTFERLARVVRQLTREQHKEIRFTVGGADTEVDKLIVEELADPLLHIVRNAIDHGIERAELRAEQGKPAMGTLAVTAYPKGNHVVIEVEDDGAGMDAEEILAAAVARGAVSEEAARELAPDEKLALIFLPGVSTSEEVSDLSGRGVGMDVVKTHIARLGGIVDVRSEVGIGAKLTLTLPITLAIISALVVRVAGRTFALPLTAVQEALLLRPESLRHVEGREVVALRGATLPLCRLDRLFGLRGAEDLGGPPAKEYVVVTTLGQRRLGLVVHGLEGQQDIIIKPLGPSLADVRGFAGATDLGDQRVVLVLDAQAVLEEVLAGPERRRSGPSAEALPA
jgi:two-component system chemotaxis sensor kinase CheA